MTPFSESHLAYEVDPIGGTAEIGFLIGTPAAPASCYHAAMRAVCRSC